MAKVIISPAQLMQWNHNGNHPAFGQRTVIEDAEMMYLVHIKHKDIDLTKWWKTKDRLWILIEAMDFSHLENTVDYFSRDNVQINPERQAAFENVILEYMKRKVDNEVLTNKAMKLMENLDESNETAP
jgi:hypothetical protein